VLNIKKIQNIIKQKICNHIFSAEDVLLLLENTFKTDNILGINYKQFLCLEF